MGYLIPSLSFSSGSLAAGASSGNPNPVGVNFAAGGSGALYYEDFPITQDLVPMGGPFYQATAGSISSTFATLDASGWASQDFGQYLHSTQQNPGPSWLTAGNLACGIISKGTGAETIRGVNCTILNIVRNGTLVTFDVTPPATGAFGVTITGTTGGVSSWWAYPANYRATAATLIASQGNAHVDITVANVKGGLPIFTTDAVKFYKAFPIRWMWALESWYCAGSQKITFATNPVAGATSATLNANTLAPGTYNIFFQPTSLPPGAPTATTCADARSITITSTGQTAISWTGGLNIGASAIWLPCSSVTRNTAANTKCQKSWGGAGYSVEGYPAEWALAFAVACSQGLYITLPVNDDGTWYQALLQDVYNNIPAGIPVYIEWSNELWNQTATANVPFYALAFQANPTATSAIQAAGYFMASRWHDIATYGKGLFGARWNTDIRPLMAWQEGTSNMQSTALARYVAQGWTPNTDIYSTSVAIYVNASPAIATTDTVATIITKLNAGALLQPGANKTEHLLALSKWYGLPGNVVGYEWGWDSKALWNNGNSGYLNLGAACLDPGMSGVYQSLGQGSIDYGMAPFFVFESGCSNNATAGAPLDEWDYNYDRVVGNTTPTPPRLAGLQTLIPGTYVPQRNVLANGVAIDGRNYLDGNTGNAYPTFTSQFNVSPINNYNIGYHVYIASAATLSLQGYFTTSAGTGTAGTINFYVDGTPVTTSIAIPLGLNGTSSAPVTLGSFAFTAGHHYIELGRGAYPGNITVNQISAGQTFNFYISTTGSDTNTGTLASPWAITAINTKQATYAGKRLGLLPGTYDVSGLMGTNESVAALTLVGGTASNAQTYIGSSDVNGYYSRGTATLDAKGASGFYGGGNANASPILAARSGSNYWTVDGLRFIGFSMWAFHIGDSPSGGACITNWTIQNCEFTGGNDSFNTTSNGVNCGILIVYASVNGVFTQNWCHDNVASTDTQHWSCIYQWGLGNTATANNSYTYNTIVKSGNFQGKEATQYNTEIAYNYFDMTGQVATAEYTGAAIFGFMSDSGSASATGTNWHHNVIQANAIGMDFNNTNPTSSYTNSPLNVYNNTIVLVGKTTDGYLNGGYDGAGKNHQVSFWNNLYYAGAITQTAYGSWLTNTDCLLLCDYNIYPNWTSNGAFNTVAPGATSSAGLTAYASLAAWSTAVGGLEVHSSTNGTNPFTNAGTYAKQYEVQSGSPAYQTGRVGGTSVGAACNIGAWDGTVTQIGANWVS